MIEVGSASPPDTLALGRKLAGLLRPGDVVLLGGRLGAGKTLLATGIAEGLGVAETVTSPSFVLVRRYEGFMPVVHADVYRLGSTGELDDLELPEAARDGVLLIEWGNVVAAGVPADHLLVEIEIGDAEERTIRVIPRGGWDDRPIEELLA
ncbi:MAG: tRNA (adenosine(37)-N6)-threonylcarbamoyltransferase complex ATPase subunit type 1 TsaE [Acidimicrobiia bacterium]